MMNTRFKKVRKTLGLTQTQMGSALGKKLRIIQYYESGNTNITLDVVNELKNKFDINPNYIITGQGDMFLSEKTASFYAPASDNSMTEIKYFTSIRASAGHGAFNYNEDWEPYYVSSRLVKNKELEDVIGVLGDSMEPELKNNDKVLVTRDKGQTLEPRRNKIYVIRQDDCLYIKRFKGMDEEGKFIFKSDNKEYDNDIILDNASDIVAVVKYLFRDYGVDDD